MIRTFKSKALKKYWLSNDATKLPSDDVERIRRKLQALEKAKKPSDLKIPGFDFHELTGDRKGTYSIKVRSNWKITFGFENEDAVNINFEDYH